MIGRAPEDTQRTPVVERAHLQKEEGRYFLFLYISEFNMQFTVLVVAQCSVRSNGCEQRANRASNSLPFSKGTRRTLTIKVEVSRNRSTQFDRHDSSPLENRAPGTPVMHLIKRGHISV